jgi:DNA (cytosine-5)-methyltransferase 1
MTCPGCGKPKFLDLFCCQGGTTRGYQLAGFCVTGVDITPQPRYIGEGFHQADAVEFVRRNTRWAMRTFAATGGSPPCQRYSKTQRIQGREHPDLIADTREVLDATGLPYVIENVEDAREELKTPILLCGSMFGLHTYRHRLFETGGGFRFIAPPHHRHPVSAVKMGRPLVDGDWYHAVGNFSNVPYVRRDMGMGWASREGIREAVPPAYTALIGRQLMRHILWER